MTQKKMTDTERQMQRDRRDDAIVAYYLAGNKLAACSSKFNLGRQRTQQILESRGVWKPYAPSDRTKHLGVTVTEETKKALTEEADAKGVSVSQLVSDKLEADRSKTEMVKESA